LAFFLCLIATQQSVWHPKKYLRTIQEKVDVLEVATAYRDKV